MFWIILIPVLSFAIIFSVLPSNVSAQDSRSNNESSSASNHSNIQNAGPFQGEDIKILAITSFARANEWIPIENYTANGYEIKSIIPQGKHLFVVLEKESD